MLPGRPPFLRPGGTPDSSPPLQRRGSRASGHRAVGTAEMHPFAAFQASPTGRVSRSSRILGVETPGYYQTSLRDAVLILRSEV